MSLNSRNSSERCPAGNDPRSSALAPAADVVLGNRELPPAKQLSTTSHDGDAGETIAAPSPIGTSRESGPDWDFAAEELGRDQELLHVVVAGCREELPKLRQALAEALRLGDRADARRLALLIDESVRAFRAVRLSHLARRLARSAETASADRHALFAELVATLDHFLQQLPIPA